ncbi:MAG: TIGR02996 domain-containing protein [Myxococcaceae bacterium]|nr:TIGR02996 domain-containing protein [Myxococcaceae bacterium]
MPDLLAIVSKAVFDAGHRSAAVGEVLAIDRYVSTNKALEPLGGGGRLFLVTVRPPDERLWLVAVLESPKHDGTAWVAKPNTRPIADLTALRGRIRFTSDTGISATKGALGMSLQTPRQLTAEDVTMMLGAPAASAPHTAAKPAPPPKQVPGPNAPPPRPPGKAAGDDDSQHLAAGRWAKALGPLLARWKDERAPELAELIERVSSQLQPPKSWNLKAADAAAFDLLALLSTLTDGKFADSLSRIQKLETLPPDPRVAAALTRLLVTPPFTAQSSREFWSSLFDQLSDRHADPRTLEALRPIAKDYQATFGRTKMGEALERRVQALVKTLSERFPTLPHADVTKELALLPAAKAASMPAKAKSGQSLEALLAAVYERPDDDGVREVYADALLEAGDPRGEFMTLQLRRARGETLSPAEVRQEAALQKKHVKAWLGPLYDVLQTTHLEFRRGFLDSARIRPVGKAIAAARNHPAWSTVRRLNMSTGGTNERGTSLILQPNARRIRELTNVVYLVLDELAASPGEGRELEVLHVSWLPLGDGEGEYGAVAMRAWKATLAGAAFPKLRELRFGSQSSQVQVEALDGLWTSPLVERLERVRFSSQTFNASKRLAWAASKCSPRLAVELDFGPFLCVVRPGGRLELRAVESRRIDTTWDKLVAELDPAVWKHVTVSAGALTEPQLAALRERLSSAAFV